MGENEFNLREWTKSWAKEQQRSPESGTPDRRGHGPDRDEPARKGKEKATAKGGRRGGRVEAKAPAIVEEVMPVASTDEDRRPAVQDVSGEHRADTKVTSADVKSPFVVLKYIESLAGEKDYFRKLEQALKENVSVLVPHMMSMEQFTKCLSNLRDSNIEADKNTGSSDDPMAELRRFLSGEAA